MAFALTLGLAPSLFPRDGDFFSARFLVLLFAGLLGALWACATLRRKDNVPLVIYPLMVPAILAIACIAKYLGGMADTAIR